MQPDLPAQPPTGGDLLPEPPRRRAWLPALSAVGVLAVLAMALVVVLGGSSGSTAVTDAAAVVHGAGERATQAGSSSVDLQVTMTVAGRKVAESGSGAFDYRRRVGRLAMTMDGLGGMQEILTPDAIYLRMPDSVSGVLASAGRPWLRMRLSAFKSAGVDMSKLMNANGGTDPSAMLKVLSRTTGVHRDGTDRVRGVKTTRYSGSATMLDMLRAEGLRSAVNFSKLPPGMGTAQVRLSVWVDAAGMARQMSMHIDMALYGSMDMTMQLYDFGKPVTVAAPPADIVTDISQEIMSGRPGG